MKRTSVLKPHELLPHLLFWREKRSQFFQYLFEITSNIQLISIIYAGQCFIKLQSAKDTVNHYFQQAFQIISNFDILTSTVSSLSLNIFTLAIWVYFLLLALMIIFIYTKYYKYDKPRDIYSPILSFWAQIHHSILFWMINILLIWENHHGSFTESNFFGFELQYFEGIINIFAIILNTLFAIVAALYCYDPLITNNQFSCYSSNFQILTFLFKLIMSLLFPLLDDNKELLQWAFFIIACIIAGLRYGLLLKTVTYYKYSAFLLTACMSGCSFILSLSNLVLAVIRELGFISWQGNVYISLLFVCFSIKFTLNRIHSMISYYTSLTNDKLRTETDVLKKLFALTYSIDNAFFTLKFDSTNPHNLSSVHLQAELVHHKDICQNENCFCKFSKEPPDADQQKIITVGKANREFIGTLKSELLKFAVKRFKTNNELKILYAFTLFKEVKSVSRALFTLFDVDRSKAIFRHRILLSFLHHRFEEALTHFLSSTEKEENQKFNTTRLINYQDKSHELIYSVERHTFEYLQVWEYYMRSNMTLIKFLQKMSKLEEEAEKIQNLWNNFSFSYKDLSKELCPLYGAYLRLIQNAPYTAHQVCDYPMFDFQDPLEPKIKHSVVICVGMSKDKLGKIIQVSRNVNKELGWPQINLIGKDISIIQPPYVQEKHSQILNKHIENSNKFVTFNNKHGFCLTREGYITPVHIYITIYPVIQNDLIYVGTIQKKEMTEETLVVRPDGSINCFSKGIASILNLEVTKKYHLSQVCKNFRKLGLNRSERRRTTYMLQRPELYRSDNVDSPSEKENDQVQFDEQEITLKFHKIPDQYQTKHKEILFSVKVEKHTILKDNFFYLFLRQKRSFEVYEGTFMSARDSQPSDQLTGRAITGFLSFTKESNFRSIDRRNFMKNVLSGASRTIHILPKGNQFGENLNMIYKTSEDHLDVLEELDDDSSPIDIRQMSSTRIPLRESTQKGNIPENILGDLAKPKSSKENANFKSKIEEAIYAVPEEKSKRVLGYSIIFYLFLCVILMITHLIQEDNLLSQIIIHVDAIAAAQYQSIYTIDIHRQVRFITLVNRGLISDTRHITLGVSSFRLSRRQVLVNAVQTLNWLNNKVLDNIITMIDDGSLRKYFSKSIQIKEKKAGELFTRQVDKFDLVNELTNAARILGNTNVNEINDNNPNVKFIFENSVNDILLINDDLTQVLTQNCKEHFSNIRITLLYFCIILLFGAVIIFAILAFDTNKVYQKRSRIIEFLLRIDEDELLNHLQEVKRLHQKLCKNHFDAYDLKTLRRDTMNISSAKVKLQNRDRMRTSNKVINYQGLNTQMNRGIVFTIVCILLFSSIFPISAIYYNLDTKGFYGQTDRMVKVNELLIDLDLILLSSQMIISEDGSVLIRNKPIQEELNRLFTEARNIPDFFSSLTKVNDDKQVPSLSTLMIGDICKIIEIPKYPKALCSALGGGIITEGLIRLISFIVEGFGESITTYIYSNHTVEAAKLALNINSLISAEQVSVYATRGYEIIQENLKKQLQDTMINYKQESIFLIIAYAWIYVIVGSIWYFKTWKKMKNEWTSWRKILRQVPFSIVLTDKAFKNFLICNCDGALNPIKHVL